MKYRVLNATLIPNVKCVPLREDESPDFSYLPIRDKHFAYDSNSHALLEIESFNDYLELRKNPPSPHIMANYKPSFELMLDKSVKSLCLNVLHDCNLACSYCFSYDTEIPLLSGETKTLGDLIEANQPVWVYSYDQKTNRIKPAKAYPVATRENAKLLEVEIDNGEKIKCTPDHRFMLRDGTYREAQHLQPNDSLMPLYRQISGDLKSEVSGYEKTYQPATDKYEFTHCWVAHEHQLAADYDNELNSLIYHAQKTTQHNTVHHKNSNKLDNQPDNLVWMKKLEHFFYHSVNFSETMKKFWADKKENDPEFIKRMGEITGKTLKDLWIDPEWKKFKSELTSQRLKELWKDPEYRKNMIEKRKQNYHNGGVKEKLLSGLKKKSSDPEYQKRRSEISKRVIKTIREKNSPTYFSDRMRHVNSYRLYLLRNGLNKSEYSYTQYCETNPSPVKNHKVVAVRNVEGTENVGCLSVPEFGNFAIAAGVFVKNCFVREVYESHGTGNFMTFPTAKRAIDSLLNPKTGLDVGFFGGEPLLNMSLLKDVVAYTEQKAIEEGPDCFSCGGGGVTQGEKCRRCRGFGKRMPSFHVTTNGTLYSPENLKFLNDHDFSLITSLDGDEETHDSLRPMKRSGTGSYKNIIRGLKALKEFPIVRSNTLRSTYANLGVTTLKERLIHLNELVDEGCGGNVAVEPAVTSEASCFQPNHNELEIHTGNVWKFHEEYQDASQWWADEVNKGNNPKWHHIYKNIERVFWCVHAGSECGAGRAYITANASGQLFACHRESNSYIGDLKNGFDNSLRNPWLNNLIYERTGCQTCMRRFACGGGCREESNADTGNLHEPSTVSCAFKSMWFEAGVWAISQISKERLSEVVFNPNNNRGINVSSLPFYSSEVLPVDEFNIPLPKWVGGVPLSTLIKTDGEKQVGFPVIDEPQESMFRTANTYQSELVNRMLS